MTRSGPARVLVTALSLAVTGGCGGSQTPPETPASIPSASAAGSSDSHYRLAENAPPDRPLGVTESSAEQFEQLITPYVRQARTTYPDAKRRFLIGLPAGENFFVTTRIRDDSGRFEQAFIHVEGIAGDVISGSIASDLNLVRSHRRGDHYQLQEAELVDWLISKPDGSEEGNVVGKFLDTLQK